MQVEGDHINQAWLTKTIDEAHCAWITPNSPWRLLSYKEGKALLDYAGNTAPPGKFYVQTNMILESVVPRDPNQEFLRKGPKDVVWPDVYCHWDRNNLPTAQRDACSAIERQRDEIIRKAQANPSRQLLKRENDMRPLIRAAIAATIAVECGLRSDRWGRTIAYGVVAARQQEPELSNDENIAAMADEARAEAGARRDYSCAGLLNSPTMKDLDRLQYRLTGGYH